MEDLECVPTKSLQDGGGGVSAFNENVTGWHRAGFSDVGDVDIESVPVGDSGYFRRTVEVVGEGDNSWAGGCHVAENLSFPFGVQQ